MIHEVPDNTPPARQWTVDGFARFWANPANLELIVPQVVWPDIKGYWPCAKRPLVGRAAYVKGLVDFLAAVPGFRVEESDSATNGDVVFIRWVAVGNPPVGTQRIMGVDRMIVKDGFVLENRIHSDHPVFAQLASTGLLG